MKKIGLILVLSFAYCLGVIAAPPPPPRHHHGGPGNSGVRLAADIIGLVGAGLDVLRPPVVYGGGYYGGSTVVVMPPAQPAVVAAPPPRVTYVPVQGMYGIDGCPVYQKVVVPDNVTYVTMPNPPGGPGAVVVPCNTATTPVIINR